MVSSEDIQLAKTELKGTIVRVETDPKTGEKTFVSLKGKKVKSSGISFEAAQSSGLSVQTSGPFTTIGGRIFQEGVLVGTSSGGFFPDRAERLARARAERKAEAGTGETVIVVDPKAKKTAIVDKDTGRIKGTRKRLGSGAIEFGRGETLRSRSNDTPRPAEDAAKLSRLEQSFDRPGRTDRNFVGPAKPETKFEGLLKKRKKELLEGAGVEKFTAHFPQITIIKDVEGGKSVTRIGTQVSESKSGKIGITTTKPASGKMVITDETVVSGRFRDEPRRTSPILDKAFSKTKDILGTTATVSVKKFGELDTFLKKEVTSKIPKSIEEDLLSRADKKRAREPVFKFTKKVDNFLVSKGLPDINVGSSTLEFQAGLVSGVKEKPAKALVTAGAFFFLPKGLKTASNILKPIKLSSPFAAGLIEGGILSTEASIVGLYSKDIIKRTSSAERPMKEFGDITSTEIIPMSLGARAGAEFFMRSDAFFGEVFAKRNMDGLFNSKGGSFRFFNKKPSEEPFFTIEKADGSIKSGVIPKEKGFISNIFKEKIPKTEVISEKVLREGGLDKSPRSQHLESFIGADDPIQKRDLSKGDIAVLHASSGIKETAATGILSGGGNRILEGPDYLRGLFVAPSDKGAAGFLGIGKSGIPEEVGGSILDAYATPKFMHIEVEGVRIRKTKKTRFKSESGQRLREFVGKDKPGFVDIPKVKTEIEGVINPDGQFVKPLHKRFFTTHKFTRVGIDEFKLVPEGTPGSKPIGEIQLGFTPGKVSSSRARGKLPKLSSSSKSSSSSSRSSSKSSSSGSSFLSSGSSFLSSGSSSLSSSGSSRSSGSSSRSSSSSSGSSGSSSASSGSSTITRITTGGGFFPFIKPIKLKGKKKKEKKKGLFGKFQPSVRASEELIFGSKPSRLTGIELRPIPIKLR